MGRTGKLWGLIITVFVLMIAQNVTATGDNGLYTCWGGCVNKCFLLGDVPPALRFPCYFQCMTDCFQPSAANNNYYCKVVCSAQLCLRVSSDAERLKRCLGNCGNVCRD